LFAFEKGEEISSHASEGDALMLVLDGVGKVTLDGKEHLLHVGEAIVMPARVPHAVYAVERFKMLLTVSFPQ
jgi:quercetin dioxygenase-like cupin family protein